MVQGGPANIDNVTDDVMTCSIKFYFRVSGPKEYSLCSAGLDMYLRDGEELVLCISWQTGYTRFGFLLLGSYVN